MRRVIGQCDGNNHGCVETMLSRVINIKPVVLTIPCTINGKLSAQTFMEQQGGRQRHFEGDLWAMCIGTLLQWCVQMAMIFRGGIIILSELTCSVMGNSLLSGSWNNKGVCIMRRKMNQHVGASFAECDVP